MLQLISYVRQDLQCDNVQANLLDQIRIVAKGQPILAWTSKYNCVSLIVGKTKIKTKTKLFCFVKKKKKCFFRVAQSPIQIR